MIATNVTQIKLAEQSQAFFDWKLIFAQKLSIWRVEEEGRERWMDHVRKELRSLSYNIPSVRCVLHYILYWLQIQRLFV